MYSSWPMGAELVAILASSGELKGSTERGFILFIQPYKPAPYNAYEANSWSWQITRRILPQCDIQYTGTCRQLASTVYLFFLPPLLSVFDAGLLLCLWRLGGRVKTWNTSWGTQRLANVSLTPPCFSIVVTSMDSILKWSQLKVEWRTVITADFEHKQQESSFFWHLKR
jgi:hypothetical protein